MHHRHRGASPVLSPRARSWSDARMRSATISSTYSNPNNQSETSKKNDKPSIFAIVKLSARKLILVDNVLGLHLPLLQLVWDQVDFTMAEETTVSGIMPTDTDTMSAYYPTVSITSNEARTHFEQHPSNASLMTHPLNTLFEHRSVTQERILWRPLRSTSVPPAPPCLRNKWLNGSSSKQICWPITSTTSRSAGSLCWSD